MLRRLLPVTVAGLLAAGVLAGYNVVFAQEITSDAKELDQSANTIWMFGAFLVFFMQAGCAFLGAGLIRGKNTVNYMTKSFLDFGMASLSFWAFGFALMWGTSALGIAGTTNFLLTDAAKGQNYVDWVFQMVFAATAATIVAGAVAERTRTQAYLAYSFMIGAIIYPIYGHWVWGGGWLGADAGFLVRIGLPAAKDYAGSGVVHAVGGFVALAGAAVVGPRIGKYNADGSANTILGHNLPFVVIGTFILFFGWFGFNAGSALEVGPTAVKAFINTHIAAVTAMAVWVLVERIHQGKSTTLGACSGAIAGLATITPAAGLVGVNSAVVTGILAGFFCYLAVLSKNRLGYDDALDVVGIHGVGGVLGSLCVGIFSSQGQFPVQAIGVAATVGFTLVGTYILAKAVDMLFGLRVDSEAEVTGLDITEHGEEAYVF